MSIKKVLEIACAQPVREKSRYLTRDEAERFYQNANHGEDDISGFYFDLEVLRQFINDIDTANQLPVIEPGDRGIERSREDFEKIKGIRIWKTKSTAYPSFDEKGKGVGEGVLMDDLIMTPTLGEKGMTSDLHANHLGNNIVSAGAEALLILGIGQPCPNQCPSGPRFFFQHS